MGHMLMARNFAFVWAFIACVFYYPYIGAGFIALGMLAHYLLICAVFALIPREDSRK